MPGAIARVETRYPDRVRVCSLLVAACLAGGCRFGFDELASADATGGPVSDARGVVDAPGAPDDSGGLMVPGITFGERPTSDHKGVTTDATLDESSPIANWGGASAMSLSAFTSYREHGVLRFDLSALAPGTPAIGARLALAKVDYGDETPGPLEVRFVAESWVEGTSNGVPGAGGASWSGRGTLMAWTTPGGTTSGTITTVTPDAPELVVLLPAQLVQTWIDDPATNNGVLLAPGATGAHFHLHSRESTADGGSHRPELTIVLAQ